MILSSDSETVCDASLQSSRALSTSFKKRDDRRGVGTAGGSRRGRKGCEMAWPGRPEAQDQRCAPTGDLESPTRSNSVPATPRENEHSGKRAEI